MSGIRILTKRHKRPWTLRQLCSHLNRLLLELKPGLEVRPTLLTAAIRSANTELFYAVDAEDNLVGYAELLVWHSATGTAGYVENVVVTQKHQRKGVGGMLMRALLETAVQHQCVSIHLHTGKWRKGAQSLYKSLRFVPKETTVLIKSFP